MTASNEILFTAEFLHEYYTDGKCPDLEIVPASATARIMKGQWLSMHSFENGFNLAYSSEKLADPQDPAFTYEKLHFLLRVKKDDFFHYTAIDWKERFLFYYSFDTAGQQLETSQIKLFGQLFNYQFSVVQIAPVTISITNASGVQVYEETLDITENDNDVQIDLRNQPGGQYNIIILQNEVPVHEEKCVIDTDLLGAKIFGILEIPELSPADPAPLFQVAFESSQSTWKYYVIVKKEYPEHIHVIEDREDGAQNNRYSNILFEFVERPVETAIDGLRVFLFETGTINNQDEFVPQLIPAFEENKQELFLIMYEYKIGGGGGNSYIVKKFVDDAYWDYDKKKHVIPQGQNPYHSKKLKKNHDETIKKPEKPPMNKLNKEVFIYL